MDAMQQMQKTTQDDEIEIDLRELFFYLLGRIWTLVICAVIGVLIAGGVTKLAITPVYQSTSTIYIKGGTDLSSISLSDLQTSAALAKDYPLLVTSRPVINKVISNLELDMTYEELAGMVTATNPTDTHYLEITVQNADPNIAETIVNDLTSVVIKQTASVLKTTEPTIVENGIVEEAPVSPSLKKNVAVGGAIGLILALIVFVILFICDDSIKNADDVERYLGLNTIGTIPMEEGVSKKKERKKEDSRSRKKRYKS